MKKFNLIFKICACVLCLINIIFSFLEYGGRYYGDNIFAFIAGRANGIYVGFVFENSIAGSIFGVLSIAAFIGLVVSIILRFSRKKDIIIFDMIFSGVIIIAAIFGIFASNYAFDHATFIGELSSGKYAWGYITSFGSFVLDSICVISSTLILLSIVAIIFQIIILVKKTQQSAVAPTYVAPATSNGTTKFCPSCGNQIVPGTAFCRNCGFKL